MSATTGSFVWHELHTNDRTKALKFYAALMAWETKDVQMGPGEPYGLCFVNGKDHAGITKSMAPAHVPPHWLPYVAVDDVDVSVAKVQELGGRLLMPAMDIPDVGRFAPVTDPQGAAFALYKDSKVRAAEAGVPALGAFCWEELMTSDHEGAAKFYAGVFGYTVESVDMGPMGTYRILKTGDKQRAGIMMLPGQARQHAHWLAYLHVADVDQATRNAKELGAKVLVNPMDIPKIGRFSVLEDPTGAAIALFKGA